MFTNTEIEIYALFENSIMYILKYQIALGKMAILIMTIEV